MKSNKGPVLKILLVSSLILFAASLLAALPYVNNALFQKKYLKGPVKVEKAKGGWHLTVGGEPFFVKGVCYQYVPIGQGGLYDLFADPRKPWMTDGKLMADMGVNAVRFYKAGKSVGQTKEAIGDLFENFGIKTALGHYLGFWDWPSANYADPIFRNKVKDEVIEMVKEYKDEDGILFWILGNENNYSFEIGLRDWSTPEIDALPSAAQAKKAKAEIYYTFVNDLAIAIKEIDPNHPVVMGNGELASIHIAKEYCPDVDILGGLVYQGKTFGSYFERLKKNFDKPNVFIEFGADRYDTLWQQESQDWQAFFLKLQWLEIVKNKTRRNDGGNSLGGFVFEWCDEWWKHSPDYAPAWNTHNVEGGWSNTAYYYDAKAGDNMSEEWWGIVGLDPKDIEDNMEKRVPKKAYYLLKSLWSDKMSRARKIFVIPAIVFFITSVLLLLAGRKPDKYRK